MFNRAIAILGLVFIIGSPALAITSSAKTAAPESQTQNTEALRQHLETEPENADLWRRIAAAEAADGNLEKSYIAINRAISIAPDDRDIQLARANILLWRDRLSLAGNQADAVRAVDPDYPGLAGFDRSLARRQAEVSKFEALSFSAVLGTSDIEFENGRKQNWENGVIALAFGNVERTIYELNVDAERRADTDVRLSGRATTRIRNGNYYLGAGITPDADFRDQWRLVAGGQALLASGWRGTADLRLARYRSGMSASIEPGISYIAARGIRISARMINLLDGDGDYRIGAAARADFELADGHILFASAARYPDREADVTKQLRSFALGGTINLDPRWRLRLTASDEKREDSYHSQSVNLGLTYRFDQP